MPYILIPIFSAMLFGLYPSALRFALQDGANVSFVVIITNFSRALFLIIFCLLKKYSFIPSKSSIKGIFLAAFFQFLCILGIMIALLYIPGPVMITIIFLSTTFILLFYYITGKRTPDLKSILPCLFALFGISLVVDIYENFENIEWIGIFFAFLASIASTIRMLIYEKEMKGKNPAGVGASIFLLTFILSLSLLFFDAPLAPNSIKGISAVVASCLTLGIGTFGIFYGIALLDAFKFSMLIKLEPVFTAIFSIIIMKEYLKSHQYLGILIVILSLIFFQYFDKKDKKTN